MKPASSCKLWSDLRWKSSKEDGENFSQFWFIHKNWIERATRPKYIGIGGRVLAAFFIHVWFDVRGVPDQFFFCHPVTLESICYRTRAKRLINKGNTTGGLRRNIIQNGLKVILVFCALHFWVHISVPPVQIFLSPPVVLPSFISRFALVR